MSIVVYSVDRLTTPNYQTPSGTALGEATLIIFSGSGRFHSGLANVTVTIGGAAVPVTFASAQPDFVGLDQVNIKLPRSLSGRGEVDVVLTVDGKAANPVRIHLR